MTPCMLCGHLQFFPHLSLTRSSRLSAWFLTSPHFPSLLRSSKPHGSSPLRCLGGSPHHSSPHFHCRGREKTNPIRPPPNLRWERRWSHGQRQMDVLSPAGGSSTGWGACLDPAAEAMMMAASQQCPSTGNTAQPSWIRAPGSEPSWVLRAPAKLCLWTGPLTRIVGIGGIGS